MHVQADGSVVQPQAADGAFGDGIDLVYAGPASTAKLASLRIEGIQRAAVASFASVSARESDSSTPSSAFTISPSAESEIPTP